MYSALRAYSPTMSAETQRWVEDALLQRPRGLLTDVDGTLSAIAPTPDQARLYRGIRPLLRHALTKFDVVAAISGRPALDARRMVGITQMTYIGNHGMEHLTPNERVPAIAPEARGYQNAIADILREARAQLGPGRNDLLFENKGVTASIHYRLANEPEAARVAIRATVDPLAKQQGLMVTEGKMVVEIRPPVGLDKGTSVQTLTRNHSLRCVVYLGDDRTDIDAFRALHELRSHGACEGIAVAVRHAEAPAALTEFADITLSSIGEVPHFLRWMLLMAK